QRASRPGSAMRSGASFILSPAISASASAPVAAEVARLDNQRGAPLSRGSRPSRAALATAASGVTARIPPIAAIRTEWTSAICNLLVSVRAMSGARRVAAFGELLDDLFAERRQVIGLAAGDDALVGDHLLVHHLGAG